MHTLLSDVRSDEHQQLQDYARLTQDTRITYTDRITLRLGLWLLLSSARRADHRISRDAREQLALARDTYARREREATLTRAARISHYR
jgi:hypothetical protein